MKKWGKYVVGLIAIFSLYAEPAEVQGDEARKKVFQNQLISLGEKPTAIIQHARQMGYDYINGQPWSDKIARQGSAAGLGVLFNTGADSAKWMRINSALTTVNGRRITDRDRDKFEKAFCMKNPEATQLTERYRRG